MLDAQLTQTLGQQLFVIRDMVVLHLFKMPGPQGRDDRIHVRSAHLVVRDRLARFDQLIARGDHHEARLAAHPHARQTG